MIIIDTQILSHAYKETELKITSPTVAISSITANEFLMAQPREADRPDYYVLHPVRYGHLTMAEPGYFAPDHIGNPKWAKRGDHRTDQVIIDFGNQFPPYREFGNEAISEIINEQLIDLYKMSVAHLPKDKQKYLKKRLRFLVDRKYHCHPLNAPTIETALTLFANFVVQYSCKDNVRNTVNDVLILATAIERQSQLLTQDKLLSRFAAAQYDAPIRNETEGIVIDFCGDGSGKRKKNRESKKGYINRGWSYSLRNNRSVKGT